MAKGVLGDVEKLLRELEAEQRRGNAVEQSPRDLMHDELMHNGAWRKFCTIEQPNTRH